MVVTNSTSTATGTLRERKRLAAMKRVQREAVSRFLADGFGRVTIEEIAGAAEVSAMSVYRWFGTKEALVLWDEFDPPILAEVARQLERHAPVVAVRNAMIAVLDDVYDRERDLALDRARLIFREPALVAAAEQNSRALRAALDAMFTEQAGLDAVGATAIAAVAVALLTVAIESWQDHDGERPLADLIAEIFDVLEGSS